MEACRGPVVVAEERIFPGSEIDREVDKDSSYLDSSYRALLDHGVRESWGRLVACAFRTSEVRDPDLGPSDHTSADASVEEFEPCC